MSNPSYVQIVGISCNGLIVNNNLSSNAVVISCPSLFNNSDVNIFTNFYTGNEGKLGVVYQTYSDHIALSGLIFDTVNSNLNQDLPIRVTDEQKNPLLGGEIILRFVLYYI